MKTDTKPASPAGLSKANPEIVKGLLKAGESMKGALGIISNMAMLASKEFSKTGTSAQKVDGVLLTYKDTFDKIDANVKKHFANCLWLLVNPDNVVETAPPKGKSSAVTMKAIEAVKTAGKHTIQKLAKEARDEAGAGRKVTAKAAPKKPASFFELLAVALKDKEQLAKVKEVLAKSGYALTPITKVAEKQKPAALAIIPQANKITDQVATA